MYSRDGVLPDPDPLEIVVPWADLASSELTLDLIRSDGAPATGELVRIFQVDGGGSCVAEELGSLATYHARLLPPGEYTLTAGAPHTLLTVSGIVVGPRETVDLGVLEVPVGGRIRVTVDTSSCSAGTPVLVNVSSVSSSGNSAPISLFAQFEATDQAYLSSVLPAGSYLVHPRGLLTEGALLESTVHDGEVTDVHLVISPGIPHHLQIRGLLAHEAALQELPGPFLWYSVEVLDERARRVLIQLENLDAAAADPNAPRISRLSLPRGRYPVVVRVGKAVVGEAILSIEAGLDETATTRIDIAPRGLWSVARKRWLSDARCRCAPRATALCRLGASRRRTSSERSRGR